MATTTSTELASATQSGRLRVLMYQFFPGGGIGRYTHELAQRLQRLPGVDLSVVCSPDFEWLTQAEYDTRPVLPSLRHRNSILRRSRFLAAQVQGPRRLLALAAREKAGIIHLANINHLTFPYWKRSIPPATQLVATAHDVRRAKSIINRRWEVRALRSFYQSCGALFVHSNSQRHELQEFANIPCDTIHQVPHGPYPYSESANDRRTLRARYGISDDVDVALCFGSVRDDKNLENTLLAIQGMENPPTIVVAGRGGGKGNRPVQWYQQRVRDAGIQAHVIFMDRHIPDDEVGDLFKLADVACMTYRTEFSSQSGVLNVAMHFGVPVIVTPAPTIAESVSRHHVGVVCEDDSAASIRRGLQQWRNSRSSYASDCYADYVLNNSWAKNAEITLQVYQSLVRNSGKESAPDSEACL
jgi:glycosyltransferase involved in cell wall biosynthesis